MSNAADTTTRTYDALNRVISKTVSGMGQTKYKYDVTSGMPSYCLGEVTTDPKGNVTTKIYDRAGRLSQVKVGSDTTTYTYYDNGSLEKIAYPNSVTAEYAYYANNQLHTLANKRGSTILEAYNYTYDGSGNMLSKVDIKGTTSYLYDDLNRLLQVNEPSGKVTSYDYDRAGNRELETVTENGNTTSTAYTYNNQNRLLSTDEALSPTANRVTEYIYDDNGNLTGQLPYVLTEEESEGSLSLSLLGSDEEDSAAIYRYDKRNQMIFSSSGSYVTESAYNGEGLRIFKETEITETENEEVNSETTITKYLYEYQKVVLELDGDGNQEAFNVYGLGGNLLSRTAEGTTLYYLYNGHGDVTGLVNASGTIIATYYYDAFGNILEETGGATANNNPYRYSGYQYDTESELYYLNARYYDANIARFLTEDTYRGQQADPLSLNLYTYCANNPIKYYDPTGHKRDMVVEGSNIYTNDGNGNIYKNGVEVPSSNYGYIPSSIGGSRDGESTYTAGSNGGTVSSGSSGSSGSSSKGSSGSTSSNTTILKENEAWDWLRTGSGQSFDEFWSSGTHIDLSPNSASGNVRVNSNGTITREVNGKEYTIAPDDARYEWAATEYLIKNIGSYKDTNSVNPGNISFMSTNRSGPPLYKELQGKYYNPDIIHGILLAMDEDINWIVYEITSHNKTYEYESEYDYYLGRTIGHLITELYAAGLTVKGIGDIISSIAAGGIITVGSGGALAGVGISVIGAGAAVGTAEVSYGGSVYTISSDGFNKDYNKLEALGKTEKKKPVSGTGKEKATDVPSWAKGNAPFKSENGKEFAKRLMNEKYGVGNWSTSSSEYSKIKKWGDRGFK